MARRKKYRKGEEKFEKGRKRNGAYGDAIPKERWHADLHPETKHSVLAIIFLTIAVIFVLSFLKLGGKAGEYLYQSFDFLLGRGYFLIPIFLVLATCLFLFSKRRKIVATTIIGGGILLFCLLALLNILFEPNTGGVLGQLISVPLLQYFDFWGSLVIVSGIGISALLLLLNLPLRRKKDELSAEAIPEQKKPEAMQVEDKKTMLETVKDVFQKKALSDSENALSSPADEVAIPDKEETIAPVLSLKRFRRSSGYKFPSLDLLHGDRGRPASGDIRANSNIIKRTLENFGIVVDMDQVSIGPTVTQYTLKPAEGVKLARITALQNDLSLALAAHPLRIEAPIPGKSLVGIEVPNRTAAVVGLRALLEQKAFQEGTLPLLITLGRDVPGNPVFSDLAKMPHMMISGATGSGKSITMHSIILSLLYRNSPDSLRFIIVDPKRVELSIYNSIPHLITPVITDAKKTIRALKWAAAEMDRRYELLSRNHSRDIISYNTQVAGKQEHRTEGEDEAELLPYIVIIIDELADLMAVYPREVESSIVRLAQMARAVGIHLIVATQRPSVEVITGLIKANITSRIALQVASQIDSRTVLDMAGAEKLLGHGDMLFLSGDSGKPRRIQGAFVSEEEIKTVAKFIREQAEPDYDDSIFEAREESGASGGVNGEDDDPLYDQAKDVALQAGKVSASFLQRRLRVGYARAARLLDIMEDRGIIGPADGAKPREVLVRTADAGGGALENDDESEFEV